MAAKAVASIATILGKENRSKIGKIGPVSKGLVVALDFTKVLSERYSSHCVGQQAMSKTPA